MIYLNIWPTLLMPGTGKKGRTMKAAIRKELRGRITGALVLMMFMLFSIFAFDADAATRDEYVNSGEQKLYTESINEMLAAHAVFDEAIIFYADDPVINAYLAFTRMLYYALTSDSVGRRNDSGIPV
jgi:hypothetical protein